KTSCNWATTGPVTSTKTSWKRPSLKWSSMPAAPTQPVLQSTISSFRSETPSAAFASALVALLTRKASARSAVRTDAVSSRSAPALSGDAPTAVLLTAVVDVREPQRDRTQNDERSHEAPRRPGPAEEQEEDRPDDNRAHADAEQAEPESATQLH